MAKTEIVSLPAATDDLRAERHLLMVLGVAMSEDATVVDEDLYAATDHLYEMGALPFSKDDMRRALGRIELADLVSRNDEGEITVTDKGKLLGCLIETVGVEGGVVKITVPDGDAPLEFEALEFYEESNPANPEI